MTEEKKEEAAEETAGPTYTTEWETFPLITIADDWYESKEVHKWQTKMKRQKLQNRPVFKAIPVNGLPRAVPFVYFPSLSAMLQQVAFDIMERPCTGHLIQRIKTDTNAADGSTVGGLLYFTVTYRYYTHWGTDLKTVVRHYCAKDLGKYT